MRRGSWQPGLPREVARFIIWALVGTLWFSAADYLLSPSSSPSWSTPTPVELMMPAYAWGVLCCIAAALATSGLLWRRHAPIIAAGCLSLGIHGALAVGWMIQMASSGWPWTGWRHIGEPAFVALMWGAVAWGTHIMQAVHETTGSPRGGGSD